MAERVVPYRLTFRSPVAIFTGLGIAGLVDRVVVRNAKGLPYIPGSSVKGRLRFFAQRVLPLKEAEPGGLWRHGPNRPHCKHLAGACTLCRLFGNPSIRSGIGVGQAELPPAEKAEESESTAELFEKLLAADPNPVLHADSDLRPGIAGSRRRRSVVPDHLFFDETVPAVTFHGRIRIASELNGDEVRFLVGVGRLVDALGSRKAAGRGRLDDGVRIEVKEP